MNLLRCCFVFASPLVLTLVTPSSSATAAEKPVKVYILSGQSNMVGIGQVDGGGIRWGDEFIEPVLSVYPGAYDPDADYDKLTPSNTVKLASFGGGEPTPYPGGGTQIVRGQIQMKETGMYEFRTGYNASTENIMEVDGNEVYRKEPGQDALYTPIKLTTGEKVPFKITYLNDQANGLGWYARLDIPGTLSTVVKQQGKFPFLLNKDGNWASRDDVWYKGVVTAGANKWLSVGCGASSGQIGPELGFGWQVGELHDEPVLILKASQGNRSLGWDFLPPGSERFEAEQTDKKGEAKTYVFAGYKDSPDRWEKGTEPQPINWYAGKQYDDCVGAAKDVLKNFDENFPQWKGRGYEIAGFAWFQGHKDTGSDVHAARYEKNLVRLIKSQRNDFNAPDAPFVVATGCGNEGREGTGLQIAEAQLAVDGDQGKYPEFNGNVKSVDIRDFWPDVEQSPKNQGFHYHQNAGTYLQIGEAMGKAMVELKQQSKD
jgi:alpha-galactosidase